LAGDDCGVRQAVSSVDFADVFLLDDSLVDFSLNNSFRDDDGGIENRCAPSLNGDLLRLVGDFRENGRECSKVPLGMK